MYKRNMNGWTKHLDFMIADIICLEGAFFVAYLIWNNYVNLYMEHSYRAIPLYIILIDIFVVFFIGSYKGIMRRRMSREIMAVIKHSSLVAGLLLLFFFLNHMIGDYSRVVLSLWFVVGTLSMIVVRFGLKRYIWRKVREGKHSRSVLVVTSSECAETVIRNLKKYQYAWYRISGIAIVDKDVEEEEILGVPVVANRATLADYAQKNIVDEVFIHSEGMGKISSECAREFMSMGITVHTSLVHFAPAGMEQVIEEFSGYTVLSSSMKIATSRQLLVKRVMDICGGIVGLLLTGIAFLIFAPIIYCQSPGPIFYTQDRVGQGGRIFRIYKFRSMCLDADKIKQDLMKNNKMQGNMFKMDNDPRIIPIGRFIRKYSIDEFPQFFNVLKGDMSLVGTRPPTVEEFKKYKKHHKKRLAVKPGLTGLWQVKGRSNIVDFEKIVKLDTEYISNWSLWQDIRIIMKTIVVVVKGVGAE